MSDTPPSPEPTPRGKRTVQARYNVIVPTDATDVTFEVKANDHATEITVGFTREVLSEISEAPLNQAESVLGTGQIEPDAELNEELSAEVKEAANAGSAPILEKAQKDRAEGKPREADEDGKAQAKQGLRVWAYDRIVALPDQAKKFETVHKAGVKIYRIGCKIWEAVGDLTP